VAASAFPRRYLIDPNSLDKLRQGVDEAASVAHKTARAIATFSPSRVSNEQRVTVGFVNSLPGPDPGNHDDHAAGGRDFDAQWWEHHYEDAAADQAAHESAQLAAELDGMMPGTALDAGCGTGADAIWLARLGWQVTAVDASQTAIERARDRADRYDPEVTERLTWLVADLTVWQSSRTYDLVVSQYVHPDMPFGEFVGRLARAVAPEGRLLIVGHDDSDSHSAAHAPLPASIGVDTVVRALDVDQWEVTVAETRTRKVSRGSERITMADLVVKAHRRRG
jgi:2-polyprenyl-3-methyl-5-hydroxy-6-metoxy-1,4-benzoquinol methylase